MTTPEEPTKDGQEPAITSQEKTPGGDQAKRRPPTPSPAEALLNLPPHPAIPQGKDATTPKGGRPKDPPPPLDILQRYAAAGLTERQLVWMLGVEPSQLKRWKRYREVKDALRAGKSAQVGRVEDSLFLNCVGYYIEDERIDKKGGKITVRSWYPPVTDAQKFYLTNRAADRWQVKTTQDVNTTGRVIVEGLPVTAAERKALAARMREELKAREAGRVLTPGPVESARKN